MGIGTFLPIKTAHVENHKMANEYYQISQSTANLVNQALQEQRRVIAVGTTSCRTLETMGKSGTLAAGAGWSDIFIYPGFVFHIVCGLLTNFHLPKSTPLLLVSAFASQDMILAAYQEAILQKYRFYSYGDSLLIL